MNTVLSQLHQMRELVNQALPPRSKILPTSALYKMDIKLTKAIQDTERLATLLCASCEEIGVIDNIDLTVNLECAKDE